MKYTKSNTIQSRKKRLQEKKDFLLREINILTKERDLLLRETGHTSRIEDNTSDPPPEIPTTTFDFDRIIGKEGTTKRNIYCGIFTILLIFFICVSVGIGVTIGTELILPFIRFPLSSLPMMIVTSI